MDTRGKPTLRGRAEAIIAVLFAVAIVAAGGGAFWFVATIHPPHTEPAAVPSVAAVTPDARRAPAVEEARRLVRALIVDEHLPGVSIAVALDGAIVWAEGFGWADVDSRAPVTPQTRYRIGSISKTLTAAAAGLLHDRGRLDLDAQVQRYVPAYPAKQWAVSTRQLLADVGGVHRFREGAEILPGRNCGNLDEALRAFAGTPLLSRPGTEYRFSIYGWVLVSAIVQGASGQPYSEFMARDVFRPLGMDRTVLDGPDVDGRASFYFPRAAMRSDLGLQDAPEADYSCFAGAGAYDSTPSDLVRLGAGMLQPGFLEAGTIAEFQRPMTLASGETSEFALGWRADDVELAGVKTRQLSHRGNPMGGTAAVWLYPARGLAIAALTNVSHVKGIAPLGPKVAEVFTK
jgi:CubicO group peptidase (beta-lactamase class C family)